MNSTHALTSHAHRAARRATGFTLLEVIVVIAILAILATMLMPNLVGNDKREFRAAVDKVGDLLTMYGQRQNLGQKIVGISHDRYDNSITLLEIDTNDPTMQSGDWRLDHFVQPVKLPKFMYDTDIEFFVDGDLYDPSQWPLSSEPGQQRPTIEIHMRGPDDAAAALILSPHGVAPMIIDGVHSSGVSRMEVDLDAEGRGREDW
jgi:prepilin-type N-terminal cleavage/methylation domain-containing protein